MKPTNSQQVVATSLNYRLHVTSCYQVDDNVATCYEQPVLVLLEQLVASPGIDKMRERASAARRHLLNFCRHI